ncbi:SPOR domain-containing protein [Saccharospirillum sp.]|uniref:SPOR domain-containing protein n=1 Tax=Saccharospirillum sp. TaxID=2033801 RepID=UPI0034A02AC6
MDVRIQQRLVGALVIVALVFLIVPVVLDGDGRIPEKITQIPPKPKRPDVSHIRVAEPVADVLPALPDPPAETDSEPAGNNPAAADSAADDAEVPDTTADVAPAVEPGSRAWSVQVASFRDSTKAAELRDQLRERSYDTYVNEVLLSDGSVFTQVLVGPDGDLERVRHLQERILQQTGLQGLVVRYQP